MGKHKHNRHKGFTIPIAPIAGMIGMPGLRNGVSEIINGQYEQALNQFQSIVGIEQGKGFRVDWLINNMMPLVVGLLVHKFVGGTLGANRMLAAAGMPVFRI